MPIRTIVTFPRGLRSPALAVAYFAAVLVTHRLTQFDDRVIAVWPPAGLAFAGLLRGGLRLWPGLLLGAFAAKLVLDQSVVSAFEQAVGSTLGAIAAAFIFRRAAPDLRLNCLSAAFGLLVAAAVG